MPKPKIANDDTTFLDNRLRWWSDFATSVKEMLLYPSTSSIVFRTRQADVLLEFYQLPVALVLCRLGYMGR